jgi:hypothetical protein
VHCSEWDWVRECVAGHVTCKPARTEDLCHWPAVLRSICYVGERLACTEFPSNSFLFTYYKVSINPVFPLQCRIHVYCLYVQCIRWDWAISCYVSLCSLCLVVIDLSDCPIYALSLYIPLEYVLVLANLSVSSRCIVFVARRATFKLDCLKRFVIFRISGLWYENVTHFLVCCVVVARSLSFFLLSISFSGC